MILKIPLQFLVADIFTASKRSLGQGNVFTGVCQSFYPQGVSASESNGYVCLSLGPGGGVSLWVQATPWIHTPLETHSWTYTAPRHTYPQAHTPRYRLPWNCVTKVLVSL